MEGIRIDGNGRYKNGWDGRVENLDVGSMKIRGKGWEYNKWKLGLEFESLSKFSYLAQYKILKEIESLSQTQIFKPLYL